MKAVIFAGGVGSRLWPLSRKHSPKQFIGLVDNKTMLQLCFSRIKSVFKTPNIFVATGKHNIDSITEQLPMVSADRIIGEPARRDLGPAVGLVAAILGKKFPAEPIAFVWGADQIYRNEDKYRKLFKAADRYLSDDPDKIILLGETSRFANQNVGWIEFGDRVTRKDGLAFNQFKKFHAKPKLDIAVKYYRSPQYVWNIGDFVSTPKMILSLYQKHAPEMYKHLMNIQEAYGTAQYDKVLEKEYPHMQEISLDNAIFENMEPSNALVVSANIGYADVGAWNTYKEAFEDYPEQTVTRGNVKEINTSDSLVFNTEDKKLIVALDVDDVVIVNTDDVLLVGKKSTIHNVKGAVKTLIAEGHKDID